MKLPFILSGSGGYHNYNESPFDGDDIDIESIDELGTDTTETDFAEYLWMENEEEFDKIEWQRLEEEELMKQCMENMLEDGYDSDDSMDSDGWSSQLESLDYYSSLEMQLHDIENSTLNPLAKEFIPSSVAH